MAQRSIPLLIGDRRWWIALLATWTGIVGFSFVMHVREMEQQTQAIALEGARNMFRVVLLTRSWNASHGGVYAPVGPNTQPNPYLKHPKRDLMTTDGMALTMINPAYMTRLIGEMVRTDSGSIFRLTSLKPIRPGNAPDDWERSALMSFESGSKEASTIVSTDKGEIFRYMAPLFVEETCLKCHETQGYKVGQVRGGVSVSTPYAPIAAASAITHHQAVWTYSAVYLLVALLGWLMLEQLRRRWVELQAKIQELQDTQSQLLQSEKMASIGQLAAGVAHEINNPVGFVSSNLGTLNEYSRTLVSLLDRCRNGSATEADFAAAEFDFIKDDLTQLIQESRDGLGRVRKIVADLKDFSHVDRAEWHDADLNAGIESTLNVVWHELKYKVEVVREYGQLPLVPCIAAQINQVIMNLLVNAAQAIDEKGKITLRTGCDADSVWLEVEDTGRGMSPEVQKRIFEPFYTTKPVGKGTGLGLSLSYDIIRKHGGQIDVRSELGKGTCFRVALPLHPVSAENKAAA